MKCSWPLKKHNEGASMVAVLMAILFVMTLGGIVATVTITNVRMRQVEESSKRNFYSAEMIMDEIAVQLNNKAAEAMQLAYTDILSDYRNIMVKGGSLQKEFAYKYMKQMEKIFCDKSRDTMTTSDTHDSTKSVFVYGYYKPDDIRSKLPEDYQECFVTDSADSAFSADYEDGLFTLYGIKVDYIDDYGYETIISTDMVFRTPVLNFDSGYKVKDFMKFALIADNQIKLPGFNNITVNGSVYSGPGGIYVKSADNVSFKGNTIVTRGDINVESGSANAVFGTAASSIWAENIVTSGNGSASTTYLNGNIYVADDLSMDGLNSVVTLTGNYYGYNFLKQYDGIDHTEGARYSSAIAINGRGSRLDMQGLQYLHLAGRTYIARGINAQDDVRLGESLSVRTNQLAYYVPASFLKKDANGYVAIPADFSDEGEEQYGNYINMTNVRSYLKADEPIAVYHFKNNIGEDVYRYYLSFGSEQLANDFFTAYSALNANRINAYGNEYADAIIIDDSTLYTFKGDVMYRNSSSSNYQVKSVTIEADRWNKGEEGVYYDFADQLAKNYMSLQKYLEDWRFHASDITSSDVRFADKWDMPLTGQLLKMSDIVYYNNEVDVAGTDDPLIVVANGDYTIRSEGKGIVIVTGDVIVESSFTGMIIAGGTIQLAFDNITITADEMMVAKMFAEDAESSDPKFSYLFSTYGNVADNVIGLVQIDKYMTYQNWTRTEN